MALPFFNWSKTAASNATADSTVNWAEGQSPSSVNDSARAMMASTAGWRDDISGTITTGGTGSAYTLTSNQVFDTLAHMNGAMIAFVPHTSNVASPTLNVDGLGAKPLRYGPIASVPELQSFTLITGTPYVVTYNNSDAAFYLQNFSANPYGVPLGGLMPYVGSTAPNSAFVLPSGQALSRTTYAALFALTSTTFGAGDGSTTFNVPDLRGRSIFGLDNMGGSTASRITVAGGNFNGTTLGATGGSQSHTLTTAEMPTHTHVANVSDPSHSHNVGVYNGGGTPGSAGIQGTSQGNTTAVANAAAAATTGILVTNDNTGSSSAHTILSPAMVLPYILRVL